MFPTQYEESRTNHLTPLHAMTMPYACWFLLRVYHIDDFKWRLSSSTWGCILKDCFERGIFWRAKSRSKGIIIRGSHTTSESARMGTWRGVIGCLAEGEIHSSPPEVKKNSPFSILREWKFNLPLPSFTSPQLRFYSSSIFYLRFLVAADLGTGTVSKLSKHFFEIRSSCQKRSQKRVSQHFHE